MLLSAVAWENQVGIWVCQCYYGMVVGVNKCVSECRRLSWLLDFSLFSAGSLLGVIHFPWCTQLIPVLVCLPIPACTDVHILLWTGHRKAPCGEGLSGAGAETPRVRMVTPSPVLWFSASFFSLKPGGLWEWGRREEMILANSHHLLRPYHALGIQSG